MFRFATPGDLMAVLANAGASATSERILQFSIRAGLSAEEFWTLRSEMSEKLRSRLAPLSNSQREALERDAIEAIRAYSVEDRISIPAEVLIVSGRKPSA
jgi:predicted proteasome-type protease